MHKERDRKGNDIINSKINPFWTLIIYEFD